MKKVIVFDMDGVLFDTIPFARKSFIERHPGVTEKMYNDIHSGNYHEEAKKYYHLKMKETPEEEEAFRMEYSNKKKETPLFHGIKDLLEDLYHSGYVLVLNTNAYE
jgi:phosphoglycolate phosphatase-like HAD superfamily hydrolase